jgi:hypothetical protein
MASTPADPNLLLARLVCIKNGMHVYELQARKSRMVEEACTELGDSIICDVVSRKTKEA